MNIHVILREKAQKYSSKPALIFRNKEISFSQLQDKVFRLSNVLKNQGIGKGDKVAIYLPNCPEYVYSYLACFCLGAVGVPLDYMLKSDELISCLNHSETKLLIAKPKPEISFESIKNSVPGLKSVIFCDSVVQAIGEQGGYPQALFLEELIEEANPELVEMAPPDTDPALIMYTSGTTGKPKGILLNYKHLEGSPRAMQHFVDLTDQDIKLCAIPLSHIGGFIYLQNCIIFGITVILMDRFNPHEFISNISKYRVTCFHIVPAMYMAILTLKDIGKFDLSSLRWVVVFGAPSSPDILNRFHQYCPNAQLLNGWGMTETCPPNTVTPMGSTNIASIGKPSSLCQIRIVDEAGRELPAGEVGEITISGWIVMDEYYKDPEATAQVKKNGWLYTGDLGKFDSAGFLYIVGRKKEMIKVGGQIVYAPEVEAALYKHESVAEAAVIGISDKLRGEVVKAFVVLKEGTKLSPEELRYFAKDHLANFKVPQNIELRQFLPKNRTGKIDKELLKTEDSFVKN